MNTPDDGEANLLTAEDISQGLSRLGLREGDTVLVHSSLSSFGPVAGGVDAVIDALLGVVGDSGTVLVPAFGCSDAVFDPAVSETGLGALPRAFWKRPGALRSRHPLASVAAIGPAAAELVRDHEKAETGHGKGTPYYRLYEQAGKILLLGVDQDRSTFLHTAEEIAGLSYLKTARARYLDKSGAAVEGRWSHFPGPHRDFIGLQRRLESHALVRKTRIGTCVAQLSECRPLLEALLDWLRDDPALFLSANPRLSDGIRQRAKLYRRELARESFTVAADSAYAGFTIEEAIENTLRYGIDRVVLSSVGGVAWKDLSEENRRWYLSGLRDAGLAVSAIRFEWTTSAEAIALAREARVLDVIAPSTLPAAEITALSAATRLLIENVRVPGSLLVELVSRVTGEGRRPQIAVNPLELVRVGENPFLTTFMKTTLRRHMGALYYADGIGSGARTLPGEGLAEIRELLSMIRARSFDGLIILQGESAAKFSETAEAFFEMLRELGRCPE